MDFTDKTFTSTLLYSATMLIQKFPRIQQIYVGTLGTASQTAALKTTPVLLPACINCSPVYNCLWLINTPVVAVFSCFKGA